MDEDFLLKTKTVTNLFCEHAEKMLTIDYCCYIYPQEIADNHKLESITEIWWGGGLL